MILQRTRVGNDGVLVKLHCQQPRPGQYVSVGGKYYVVAQYQDGIGSFFTRQGSSIDLPLGTQVEVSTPMGGGFNLDGDSAAVVVTGGTGFAAAIALARHFEEKKQDYKIVAFSRQDHQLRNVLKLLEMHRNDHVTTWDTAVRGRPQTPLALFSVPITKDTPFFFAGPKDLHGACRAELDKRGLTDVRIRLNY